MNCPNVKECMCPKLTCPNHGNCCKCVIKHRETDSLPYCLFPDNNGDKSNRNHYEVLKKRFENSKWSNSKDKRRGKSSPRFQASRSANRPCKQCRFSPLCCLSATPSSGDTPQRPVSTLRKEGKKQSKILHSVYFNLHIKKGRKSFFSGFSVVQGNVSPYSLEK